ncbi:hypothetical protein M0R45_017155 [Rubus argutus]|uniref:Uncharacterized protein n=1 Tax=Rubus argutus TaxID=59490 RepID=A0AAW1XW63_RUBAR
MLFSLSFQHGFSSSTSVGTVAQVLINKKLQVATRNGATVSATTVHSTAAHNCPAVTGLEGSDVGLGCAAFRCGRDELWTEHGLERMQGIGEEARRNFEKRIGATAVKRETMVVLVEARSWGIELGCRRKAQEDGQRRGSSDERRRGRGVAAVVRRRRLTAGLLVVRQLDGS